MASLNEIVQVCYDFVFPIPRSKNAIDIEDFKAAARVEYAAAMWIYRQQEMSVDGQFQMPSDLLTEIELPVENDAIDISTLNYLSALPNDLWLQGVGLGDCKCQYVKSTNNLSQILCDDDSLGGGKKPYLIVGKKIKFPQGTHTNKLSIVYANNGDGIEGDIEVNEYVGAKVRDKLLQIYSNKIPADTTNNNNVNT